MPQRANLSRLALLTTLVLGAGPASAQLISPGRLIEAHAGLEGVTNCTSCHALGQRGIDPQRCLDCHTPLRTRIERGEGFHSSVPTNCGTCHKDHFGRDFDPVRLDRATFDHDATGYPLVGGHVGVTCESCHRPAFITAADVRAYHQGTGRLDRTFLGVSASCQTCHRRENAHGPRFERSNCQTCHSPLGWERIEAFDHATTGFPLTGSHVSLSCTSCHGRTEAAAVTFDGLSTSCRSCHGGADPHGAQFAGRDCASCHGDAAWRPASRFSHDRARFALTGSHRSVACSSCHGAISARTVFVGIDFAECSSCHADPHAGSMGADCSTCHTTADWRRMAGTFDEQRFEHAATGFPLVGAHAAAPCSGCHARPARNDEAIRITFAPGEAIATFPRPAVSDCTSCHVDAHRGVFEASASGAVCSSCHTETSWVPATFGTARHQGEGSFPLTGAHVATPCHACHGAAMPEFRFESTACESCHLERNPHGDQFADAAGVTACGTCHSTEAWSSAAFDHAATGFPLTGAHMTLSCESCHTLTRTVGGRVTRDFAGLAGTCASCHAGDDPHRGQFEGRACDACHDTRSFTVTAFDHGSTRFPLTGGHVGVSCGSCHLPEPAPDGGSFVRFTPMPTACASCHGASP